MADMQGERASRTRLWAIIQAHIDAQVYPPSRRQLAHKLGLAPQTLNNWHKGLTSLPQRDHLKAVSELTGAPYREVLRAALLDAGYEVEGPDDSSHHRQTG